MSMSCDCYDYKKDMFIKWKLYESCLAYTTHPSYQSELDQVGLRKQTTDYYGPQFIRVSDIKLSAAVLSAFQSISIRY